MIVIDEYNISSCKCKFGWESSWKYNSANQVSLCDIGISIVRYLTQADKPYYMLGSDVSLPLGAEKRYTLNSLRYYFRYIKYHIGNYFQPYELQIGTVFMNRDKAIMEEDYPYIIVPCVVLGLILVLTARYRCKEIQM